jgi:hypothetical protein
MRYLMFIKMAQDHPMPPPQALMDAMDAYMKESYASGKLLDTGGLYPEAQSLQLQVRQGRVTVTDGPFSEAKEIVGGFGLFRAETEEEARAEAHRMADVHTEHWPEWEGSIELRRIAEPDEGPPAA